VLGEEAGEGVVDSLLRHEDLLLLPVVKLDDVFVLVLQALLLNSGL
jgi:hypothetical protein